MTAKIVEKRLRPLPTLCFVLLLTTLVLPTIVQVSRQLKKGDRAARQSARRAGTEVAEVRSAEVGEDRLTFVTLCFNQSAVKHMVDHNCALLSQAGYDYHIYTDDHSQPYCQTCVCKPFRLKHCSCPQPHRFDCSLCEKLAFVVDLTTSMPSYVFLDSDLIIMSAIFMDALQLRSRHFDFLAAYGFGPYDNWHYYSQFNSGLMYVRRLDTVNYTKMIDIMYEMGTNNDQNVISTFVQTYYDNWDTLSLRWHCRYLYRKEHDIEFRKCFTFHGRNRALELALNESNFKLLTTTKKKQIDDLEKNQP